MLRNLVLLVTLALLSGGGYLAYDRFTEHQQLVRKLEERNRVIERLTRTSRVAQAMVTRRFTLDDGAVMTEVLFVEEGEDGEPASRKKVLVRGEQVYFDALVLKFDQDLVKEGDPIRGRSLILFRRLFGEDQAPNEGEPLDELDEYGIPAVYRDGEASQVEIDLWRDFWKFANDPAAARAAGVRIAQGEAPSIRMQEGKIYELTLDHNGGLNIAASDIPAIFLDEDG